MARYTPDFRGTRRYLQYNKDLKRELHRRVLMGQAAAIPMVPRSTGELASSSEVRDDGPNGGAQGDRMQYSLHFTAHHAVPVTYPQRRPQQRDYLEIALAVMSRGR